MRTRLQINPHRGNVPCPPIVAMPPRVQVLAVFAQAKVQWPPELIQLFKIFSAFSLNLDLAAPECAAKSITWPLK